MKIILFILFLFIAVSANAQWIEISNSLNVNYVIQNARILNCNELIRYYPVYNKPKYYEGRYFNSRYYEQKEPVVRINLELKTNYSATEYYINKWRDK